MISYFSVFLLFSGELLNFKMLKNKKISVQVKKSSSVQNGEPPRKRTRTSKVDVSAIQSSCSGTKSGDVFLVGWYRSGRRLVRNDAITILNLPVECVAKILSFLPDKEVCRAAATCKLFAEAARMPYLWKNVCVDYRFLKLRDKFPNFVFHWKDRKNSRSDKLRKKHIYHLQSRNASIRHLRYELYVNQYRSTLYKLLSRKHCCHLESLGVTCYDISLTQGEAFEQKLMFVQELLERVYLVSAGLTELLLHSCQVLAKSEHIDKVLRFRNLSHLQLQVFVRADAHLLSGDIENILQSLTQLKSLDFEVDSNLEYNMPQRVYVKLKSNSLQRMRLYYSSDFVICSLDMPQLHTFVIRYWSNFTLSTASPVVDTCLFAAILKGCPNISVINNVNITGKTLDYRNDPCKVKALKLCHCSQHGVDNPTVGAVNIFVFLGGAGFLE